jgi:hypothetical protein
MATLRFDTRQNLPVNLSLPTDEIDVRSGGRMIVTPRCPNFSCSYGCLANGF